MSVLADHLRRPFAILAGAGISYAPPSSIPTAANISRLIIKSLPIDAGAQDELIASMSWDWPHGFGYFHTLRFEQIMEALHLTIDPPLEVLDVIRQSTSPNEYHYLLAQLIALGYPAFTTNFDCLIEEAGKQQNFPVTVLSSEEDFARYSESPRRFKNPLFKLHGTLSSVKEASMDPSAAGHVCAISTPRGELPTLTFNELISTLF